MSAKTPYPYQNRVASLLLEGRSVVLQAPTGAGKTRAALLPFLHARQHLPPERFPRKCIYSVPMRVLANQFVEEFRGVILEYGWQHKLEASIQTGAVAEDPKLEGDLIFTTIDQTLSNFLNIPYALGLGQANLNAGAVLSSYLVFDELHLFDPETTLPTTLHMLKLVRGVVPFLVMTATFSTERVRVLAHELDAEPVVLSAEEAAAIPSQHKTRRIQTVEDVLTAQAVLARHRHRSIAICNTVARAQSLFDALDKAAGSSTDIRLLHSRFLRKDRDASEDWLRREFGKEPSQQHTVASAILVATQVAEVGLDISSEALHTELAPAASVLQRAGRCARYENEEGDVFVYRLPPDNQGKPSYAPYLEGGQPAICDLTWDVLGERQGEVCDFGQELAIVDYAHHAADQRLLDGLSAKRGYFAEEIERAIVSQDRSVARELIRDVDSRTVIVHPEPRTIENPWIYEGFSIFRGSLLGAYADLVQTAKELGADWVMMSAEPQPEEENQRAKTVWVWRYVKDKKDLVGAVLVAVNPALARYSNKLGFRLGVTGGPEWQSPLSIRQKARQHFAPYRRETITEHVTRIARVCSQAYFDPVTGQERQSLFAELAHASRRLEQKQGWPAGTLERVTRMAIAAHDLGKLDVRWQRWAHRWQEEVSKLRGQDLRIPGDYMVAHTDYDDSNLAERALSVHLGKRPNHAAEGAAVAINWLRSAAGDQALARAALTAIIAHHSAGATGGHDVFQAHPAGPVAFIQMIAGAGLKNQIAQEPMWKLAKGEELVNRKMRPAQEEELLAYLLIVRALRMGDQRSQSL